MNRFMGKPVPLKSLKDLANCKPVMEASLFLDAMFKRSCEALEAAEARLDEGGSKSSISSSMSSSTTHANRQTCLIVTKDKDPSLYVLQGIVEKNGWRAVVKHGNGDDALRLLKLKSWDAGKISASFFASGFLMYLTHLCTSS